MDMKPYAGKDVWIQFKGGHQWLALEANAQGALVVSTMPNPETGKGDIVPLPAINAHVSDDGEEVQVQKNNGGVIAMRFNPEVIHSVTRVVSAASSIISVASPLPS